MAEQNAALAKQQRIRRKQVLMGFAVYLTALVPLAYIEHLGLLRLGDDEKAFLVIAALLTNALFYGLVRFDVNLHFREPSMTFAQVMAASAWSLVTALAVAQPARPLAMVWYLLAFLFGFYTLKRWQFLALTVFALSGYAIVVAREFLGGDAAAFRIELLHWLILAAGLFWMSLVGSYVSMLRQRLAEQRRQLAGIAFVDPLTQAYNRRYLLDLLERELARIRRNPAATLAVAMLAVDGFGERNRRHGHLMGDRMLQRVADLLQDELRDMDAVGRFADEAFIVVMPDTSGDGAKTCMERVRRRVESDDSPFSGLEVPVSVSIGIAETQPGEAVTGLVERAGRALAAAESAGRNRVIAAPNPDGGKTGTASPVRPVHAGRTGVKME